MNEKDRRMKTDRCAHLCAVAIANQLDEAWISINPVLFLLYVAQYAPSLFRRYVASVQFNEFFFTILIFFFQVL